MTELARGVTPPAREIIGMLGPEPHPEGGWYAETFRDEAGAPRGHSTAIYYLLETGQRSHWHRVKDAAEIWHFHASDALALTLSPDKVPYRLGTNLAAGERPQLVVPAGRWQTAEPLAPLLDAPSHRASCSNSSRWRHRDGRPGAMFRQRQAWRHKPAWKTGSFTT